MRWIRRLVVALVSIWLFYVVAMNAFLWTPLFAKAIDADPLVVDVHYARAWSLWPSKIHAEGLSIRGTDSQVQWILKIDDVDFDVSLFQLAKQQFHVTRARGDGVSLRMRMKVALPASTEGRLAQAPPIDGLPEDAVLGTEGEYEGTWDDSKWKLWTIHLEDVVAEHVREIWFDGGRFRGDARITGGFYLKPIRAAEVGPAHVEIRRGVASVDSSAVFEDVRGTADVTIHRFDPRPLTDADLIHHVSVTTDLAATLSNLSVFFTLPEDASLSTSATIRRFAPRVDHGVLQDGSEVALDFPGVVLGYDGHGAIVGASIRGEVKDGRVALRVDCADASGDGVAWAPHLAIAADATQRDLATPLDDLHVALDLPWSEVTDLGAVARLAKAKDARLRGVATLRAKGEAWLAEYRATASARVDVEGDARTKGLRAAGDARVVARVGEVRWDEGLRAKDVAVDAHAAPAMVASKDLRARGAIDVSARVPALDAEAGRARVAPSRIDVTRLEVARGDRTLVTAAKASAVASAPSLAFRDPLARVHVEASVDRARPGDLAAIRALLPKDAPSVDARPDASLSAQGGVDVRDHVADGSITLQATGLGVATPKGHATADLRAVASGRLDLRGDVLTVRGADVTATKLAGGFGPEGRVDFDGGLVDVRGASAAIDLGHPKASDVDARVVVNAVTLRDARALNAVLPSGDVLAVESGTARVSADVTDARGAIDGRARVDLARATVKLHDAHLAGDVAIDAIARAVDPAARTADVEGTRIALRGVRVAGSGAAVDHWFGDVVVQQGTLRLGDAPRFDGDVTIEAKDARPALALLLGDVPKPFVGWIDMPHLAVATHLAVEPKLLVVSDFYATGDNLSLRGTYVVKDADKSGAFVIDKGPFSVGLRMGDDGAHLHLFGLGGWYAHQRDAAMRLACGAPPVGAATTTSACVTTRVR